MTLRALLEAQGIQTIAEFARRAGISRQYAWNLWHGHQNVGRDLALRLSARLNIPVEQLITLERTTLPAERPPGRPRKRPRDEPPTD